MSKKKGGFWSDFKAFITRGNVVDMAVGVVIGGAFGKIVTGLVNYIINPCVCQQTDAGVDDVIDRSCQLHHKTLRQSADRRNRSG